MKRDWEGHTVYSIENDELALTLAPSLGNNLFRIRDKKAGREVLRSPQSPQELAEQPGQFGTPLMMPPNRIRQGRFTYGGKPYRFDINTPQGHHIHGFLRGKPWTFNERQSGAAALSATYRTTDFADVMRQYPHDVEFTVTYTLEQAAVKQTFSVANRGSEPAPFGYGLHTWFMLDGEPENWTLKLPVDELWELDADCLPTGRLLPLGEYASLKRGLNLRGANLDHAFRIGENPCLAVLAKDGYEVRYSSPAGFGHWVIFTRGEADQWICLEPYTWMTDAPNIPLSPDVTGLRAIAPGETVTLELLLEIVRQN